MGYDASRLRVMVDGDAWIAEKVLIVRREKVGPHYVYLKVRDPSTDEVQEYFVDRKNMVKNWIAMEKGAQTNPSLMKIFVNKEEWEAVGISQFNDNGMFVQLDLQRAMESGVEEIIIAMDKQGMMDAFHALCTDITDLFESGLEAFGHLIN
ncbi:hypothetical protein ACFL08_02345 [Patescibacteria group bacterium]